MKCSFLSSLLIAAGALLAGSRPAHALQEVAVPCAPTGSTSPISYGEHAKCAISNVGEVDVYQFFGTAGESVRVGAMGLVWFLGCQLELFRPSDPVSAFDTNYCGGGFGYCGTSLNVVLPETGQYTIRLSDYQNNHTGNYVLNLERLPGDGQLAVLNYGSITTVNVDHQTDVDWFAFDALPGTQVSVTGSASPGCDVTLEVFSGTGALVDSKTCVGGGCTTAPLVFLPTAEGRYFLAVQDRNHDNVGTITVALSCVVGNCPTTTPIPSIGSSYCTPSQNSTSSEARISALGSRFVADNDVYLVVTGVPTQRQGLFFLGLGQQDVAFLNGCGRLCVTPPVVRRPVQFTSSSNTLQLRLDLTHPTVAPLVSPGSPTYFQAWFRDPTGTSSCSGPTNTTDGLRINFL